MIHTIRRYKFENAVRTYRDTENHQKLKWIMFWVKWEMIQSKSSYLPDTNYSRWKVCLLTLEDSWKLKINIGQRFLSFMLICIMYRFTTTKWILRNILTPDTWLDKNWELFKNVYRFWKKMVATVRDFSNSCLHNNIPKFSRRKLSCGQTHRQVVKAG